MFLEIKMDNGANMEYNTSGMANTSEYYVTTTNNGYILHHNLHEQRSEFFNTTVKIERVIIPLICGVGLFGNTIATVVFLRKSLRNTSCSLFLAARSFADNGFLLTLLLVWLKETFSIQLSHIHGLCQFVIFLTYVCGFVSVWMVVLVTIENYLRICHPFVDAHIYTTKAAKILIAGFIVTSLAIYNFPFWMVTSTCAPIVKFVKITMTFVYTDTVLTLVVPTIIIAVFLVLISYSMIQSQKRRRRLRITSLHIRKHRNLTAKVTKMLFIVSMCYFILNLPSHVIRLKLLINTFITASGPRIPSLFEQGMQKIFHLLFYASFAVNIFLYISFGQNFRNALRKIYRRRKRRSTSDTMEAVNINSYSNSRLFPSVVTTERTNIDSLIPSIDENKTDSTELKQNGSCHYSPIAFQN